MGTASGTSVLGMQTIINGTSGTAKQFSIAITNNPTPPIRRLGYFWLFAVTPTAPNQSYVLAEGILRAPGVWNIWNAPATSPTYLFRIDVDWDVIGRTFTVSIA